MKNTIILLALLVAFLTSCTNVYFNQPQPKNGKHLKFVPEELQGKWVDKLDTIFITKNGFEEVNVKTDSLEKIISVKKEKFFLSDSLVLNKAGKFYIINLLEKGNWQIIILDKQSNGDIIWYYPCKPPFFGEGRDLKVKKVIGKIKGVETIDKSLTNKDEGTSITVYYDGQFRINDIKKVILEENQLWIFKADGSIIDPQK